MELRDFLLQYQIKAAETIMPSCENIYCFFNLGAEISEVQKAHNNRVTNDDELKKELGDVLWQLVMTAKYEHVILPSKIEVFKSNSVVIILSNMKDCYLDCCGILAKGIRKLIIEIDNNQIVGTLNTDEDEWGALQLNFNAKINDLFQLFFNLLNNYGFDLQEIADLNIEKLAKRKLENTIINHGKD